MTKKLLDNMKFQWPRTPAEVKEISFQQVEWLLQGLEIEQKKAHHHGKKCQTVRPAKGVQSGGWKSRQISC